MEKHCPNCSFRSSKSEFIEHRKTPCTMKIILSTKIDGKIVNGEDLVYW